jgi:sugar (pentulose or hexulose) kinase
LIYEKVGPLDCYLRFGTAASFKSSLAKILWLRQESTACLENSVWLSVADYVAYWLTGEFGTDY